MLSNQAISGLAKLAVNLPETWTGGEEGSATSRALHQGGLQGFGNVFTNNVKGGTGVSALAYPFQAGYNMLPKRETMQKADATSPGLGSAAGSTLGSAAGSALGGVAGSTLGSAAGSAMGSVADSVGLSQYGSNLYDEMFGGPGSAVDVGLSNAYRAPAGVARTVGGGLVAAGGGAVSMMPEGMGGGTGAALRDAGIDMVQQGAGQYADAFTGDDTSMDERMYRDSLRSYNRANAQMQKIQDRNITQAEYAPIAAADVVTDLSAGMAPFASTGGVAGIAPAANAAKTTGAISRIIPGVSRLDNAVRSSRAVQGINKGFQAVKGARPIALADRAATAITRAPVRLMPAGGRASNVARKVLPYARGTTMAGDTGYFAGDFLRRPQFRSQQTKVVKPGQAQPSGDTGVPSEDTGVPFDNSYMKALGDHLAPGTLTTAPAAAGSFDNSYMKALGNHLAPNANQRYNFPSEPGVIRDPRSVMNPYSRSVEAGRQPPLPPSTATSRDPRSIMNPYDKSVEVGKQPDPVPPSYRRRKQHAINRGPNEGQSQFLSRARNKYNDTVQRRADRAAAWTPRPRSLSPP